MPILRGTLITPRGPVTGRLRFGERIEAIEPDTDAASLPTLSLPAPYVLPGFVDTHVHGGGGGDVMDGPEGVLKTARTHLRHGTTTLLPTTLTAPWERVMAALHGVREVMGSGVVGLPDLPGAHLEGPFISPDRLGAQPPHAIDPDPGLLREAFGLRVIRVMTLAPELPGALDAAREAARGGVRVSLGHTRARYEQARAVQEAVQSVGGTVGSTHLYNAMGGLEGRDPGTVGAAFADPQAYAELILDGHHVHDGAFLAALAAKPRHLHLVSDAMRAAGLGDGVSELGGQEVRIEDGAARLADGTLAGSVLTLDRALRRALRAGLSLTRASTLLSAVPARYLGLDDRGRLEPGARADLVVLDDALGVREVWVAGKQALEG